MSNNLGSNCWIARTKPELEPLLLNSGEILDDHGESLKATHLQGDEAPATIGPVPQQSTAAASSDAPRFSKRDTEHED